MENNKKWSFVNLFILLLMLVGIIFSIDFLRNIYLIFVEREIQPRYGITFLYIFIYEIACAIFWPTPSEAPLLLYPRFSLVSIIVVSAIGKGFGAWIVCRWWDIIEKTFKLFHLNNLFGQRNSINRTLVSRGFIAYFLMQSIPFMPMRSSIFIYSLISRSEAKVALGAGIGTIFRNLLMLFLFWFGYLSIKTLFLE